MLNFSKPVKPFIMRRGTPNKYNKTSLDSHNVLSNGSIVVRTLMVGARPVKDDYDANTIKIYEEAMKNYKSSQK